MIRPAREKSVGWLVTLGITLLAFAMRVWNLGKPHEFSFDETYYAKNAWSLLHFGYARGYVSDANERILNGDLANLWTAGPEMIVHPEVGKWLIGLGEALFGMDPFGWRIVPTVAGSLIVLLTVRMTLHLTRSLWMAGLAGLLVMVDGLEFVMSRLALLDIFVALFTLAGVYAVLLDRAWLRARLPETRRLLFRPWLLVGGLMFGLAVGSKWEAAYPLAVFGVMTVLWAAGSRYATGDAPDRLRALLRSLARDALPNFVHLVVVAALVYVVSWTGWLANHSQYEQYLSANQYYQYGGEGHCEGETYVADKRDPDAHWPTADVERTGLAGVGEALESLWLYHQDSYTFHTVFLDCATHSYASNPWGWLLLSRPVSISAENGIQPGEQGCAAPSGSDCLRQVTSLGNPLIWWPGILALIASLVLWIGRRDWRFGVPVLAVAAMWLPWLPQAARPIFQFYLVVAVPFIALAIVLCLGALVRLAGDDPRKRRRAAALVGLYALLAVAAFAFFWPVYTAGLLTHDHWMWRMWFSRWI